MTARTLITALATALSVTWACSNTPLPPEVTPEEANRSVTEVATVSVGRYVADRERVLDIEYALITRSAKRCGALRPRAGALLLHPGSFPDDAIREAAGRNHELGESLSVVHVIPGGPFDRAGLRPGDELLEVDGKVIRTESEFSDLLLETSDRSAIQVLAQRRGERLDRTVQLAHGCPVKFFLSRALNFQIITRQHDKLLVHVPAGVLNLIEDNDTLAVVLAHQFAHVLFDDDVRPWPEQETRADRFGLLLAAGAGFDVSGAVKYWEAVASEYPWLIDEAPDSVGPLWKGYNQYSHHGLGNRLAAIRATVQEIAVRQAASAASPAPTRPTE